MGGRDRRKARCMESRRCAIGTRQALRRRSSIGSAAGSCRSSDRGLERPERGRGPEEMGDRRHEEPMHDQSLPRYTTPRMGTARQ